MEDEIIFLYVFSILLDEDICLGSLRNSFDTNWSVRPEILTASSKVRRQKGQEMAMTLAPKETASLMRISPFLIPSVPPSAHILPPPPSQQRLLCFDLSISAKSNPGMEVRIFLGSSKTRFCFPRKHGS